MKKILLFLLFYLAMLQSGSVHAETVNVATAGTVTLLTITGTWLLFKPCGNATPNNNLQQFNLSSKP